MGSAESEEKLEPLLARVRIRYLPMLSFTRPDPRAVSPLAETIALAGKLHAKEEEGWSASAIADLSTSLANVKAYSPSRIPSRYLAPFCERLLVYSGIDVSGRRGPFGWSPLPGDRSNMDGSLSAWMTLPWGAPSQLILPGYSTAAESSLRRGGTGDELFLTSSALLAAGSRTVLLSRWRVGGKSSHGLVNEFTQELPHLSASNAWQRAVQLTRSTELDFTREPRLNRSSFSEAWNAEHPFFWAGYMLIDQTYWAPGEEPTPVPPDPAAAPPDIAAMEAGADVPPGAVAAGADAAEPLPLEEMPDPKAIAPELPGIDERLAPDAIDLAP